MYKIIFLFILIELLSGNLFAQQSVVLEVKDNLQQPVAAAQITDNGSKLLGITNPQGICVIQLQADSQVVIITATGYQSFLTKLIGSAGPLVIYLQPQKAILQETVFAFGRKSTIKNTDAAVTVLQKGLIDNYNPQSFVAAVNTVPGVKMDERSPGSYRINIRGNLLRSTFGVRNVKIYLNGLPISDASGNTYFNQISPAFINQIQIIKGPGGSMYGAGTGGVMLLNSQTDTSSQLAVQLSTGSYGALNAAVVKNIMRKKNMATISLSHEQANGYREQAAMQRNMVSSSFQLNKNSKNNLDGTIYYSHLQYQTPGGLTAFQAAANPRQARPATPLFAGAQYQKAGIYLQTLYASLSHEIKIKGSLKNRTGAYGSITSLLNPAIRNYEDRSEQGAGARTVFEWQQQKLSVTLGAEYQYSFISTATYGNRAGNKDTLQYNDKIKVRQVNVFMQSSYDITATVAVNAGVSYNNFYYGFTRVAPAEPSSGNTFQPQIVPRISIGKQWKSVSVYASVSKGFSPPTIDEVHAGNGIFNKNLNAESSTSLEVGGKINLLRNRFFGEIAIYNNKINNSIVGRKDAAGADFFTNAGGTLQNGLEFSLKGIILQKQHGFIRSFSMLTTGNIAQASFLNYQVQGQFFTDNKLTGTAPFASSIVADVLFNHSFYGNITYSFTDKIPLNDANTFYGKAYSIVFVKAGCRKKIFRNVMADFFVNGSTGLVDNYSLGNDLNADGNRFFNPAAKNNILIGVRVQAK